MGSGGRSFLIRKPGNLRERIRLLIFLKEPAIMNRKKIVSSFNEPQYSSFLEAAGATQKSIRSSLADQTFRMINGAIILDYSFDLLSLELMLSERRILRLYLSSGVVSWDLQSEGDKKTWLKQGEEKQGEDMYLDFPGTSVPFFWNRSKLVRSLLNKPIQGFSASTAWVFLEVKQLPGLMFCALTLEKNQEMLFYGPE